MHWPLVKKLPTGLLLSACLVYSPTALSVGTDVEDNSENKSSTVSYKRSNSPFAIDNCDVGEHLKELTIELTKGTFAEFGPVGIFFVTLVPVTVTVAAVYIIPGYTSSKVTGTSGCEKIETAYFNQLRFVAIAQDKLVRDMASGGGEYIESMAFLHGCPASYYQRYANLAQQNFADIYPLTETEPMEILSNLESQIKGDQELGSNCIWVF